MLAVPPGPGLLDAYFDNPRAFLVINDVVPPHLAAWRSSRTSIFTSLADLRSALRSGSSAGYAAVVYDVEGVSPLSEQQHVASSTRRAEALARAHRLRFIGALGVDMVARIDPRPRRLPAYYRDFLDLRLIPQMAPFVDVLILQGQGLEDDPIAYTAFIRQAAEQARAANPNVILVASLSTSPRGSLVSGENLYRAARAASNLVDGYWLNFGQLGGVCCDGREPEAMVDFLNRLAHP